MTISKPKTIKVSTPLTKYVTGGKTGIARVCNKKQKTCGKRHFEFI